MGNNSRDAIKHRILMVGDCRAVYEAVPQRSEKPSKVARRPATAQHNAIPGRKKGGYRDLGRSCASEFSSPVDAAINFHLYMREKDLLLSVALRLETSRIQVSVSFSHLTLPMRFIDV